MSAARRALPLSSALRFAAVLLALAAACLTVLPAEAAGPTFPALTGRITDEAGLLKPDDYAAIQQELAGIEQTSTDQVAVVTVKSLQGYAIEDYGYQLGRQWGIGQKGKDNGILLIVAPNERKVRIEVGRELEPVMTDAMSSLIIQNAILPAFRQGDYSAGISAGVRDIKAVLLGDAEAVKDRARQASNDLDFWQIVTIIFWICIVLFVISAMMQSMSQAQQAVGGRGRRAAGGFGGPVFIPGGWGGGWSGGDGGGGWSGGGGDFGGGGSSGSW